MNLLRIILLFSISYLLCQCGQKSATMTQLEMIENVLTTDIDSAQNLLAKIDSADLSKEKEGIMYYYLKNIIAVDRQNLDDFNDSTVSVLYDYAQQHSDNHLKAKAAFLKGLSFYKQRDVKQALRNLFDASNYLENVDDTYLEGLTNNMLAIIYHDTFKPGPGIKYAEQAIECFKKIGNDRNYLYSRAMFAKLQHAVNNHESAIALAPEIAEEGKKYKDIPIRLDALSTLANSYTHIEQYDKAIQVFQTLDEEHLLLPYYEGEYIFALVLNGNIKAAKERLNQTAHMPPFAQLVKAREVYFLAIGDTLNAYKQLAIVNNWQSETIANTMNDGVIDSVEESYQAAKALKAEQARSANIIKWSVIISSAVILLLLTGMGIWYYRYKMKIKNMELDQRMSEISELTNSIEDSKVHNEQLSEEIAKLFKKQWNTLNILCNEYFEKGDNPSLKATILSEVEKEIKRISGREGLKNIEDALDHHFDGVISKLKEQLPGLDKKDIAFLTFSYAGLSPRAICLFTGFTIKYYYKKRAVLKEKILASDAPDKQLFVDLLG